MCMSCGCGQPDESHGNDDHITRDMMQRAADAAGHQPPGGRGEHRDGRRADAVITLPDARAGNPACGAAIVGMGTNDAAGTAAQTRGRFVSMTGMIDGLTERVRSRATETRVGNLGREDSRLRSENTLLRSELDHERSEREDLRDVLRARPKTVRVKVKRPVLRLAVVGTAAYILGARAGHERYDEILGWAKSLFERARRDTNGLAAGVERRADEARDRVDLATRELSTRA